ncbi:MULTISPECIES: hormogonium polysaccharide secretion pseudopilin HpsB [unclassified Nostoc]|uniref:hormogonium polysaccharide secretion pseudopilin HpsB n=1 Tax=unclassified Nostoc TaxID=2593658 RepID=UPI002AD41B0A|nr:MULTISPECIES: hormogonium polysaccharide secretion pseudopilin HpsB [unclassified Nostoc]MDZ8029895.1 hormogonium polysaccharide secretion pseudopilin HpsB [Nostoc sp. DedSLP04]MDZ8127403.1 hormogonium polysaccharide secretion pseudopilin HpsB [Nostoc sp. DedQUE07]
MNPRQLQELSAQSNDSGFTIIESLVAILVVAILLVAIAPVLVMSTATRVQAKRVELATGAAKAFVDAIKSKTISDPTITVTLTASTTRNVSSSSSDYLLSSTLAPTASTGLYCFNKNGSLANPDCTSDLFYIQAIRVAVTDSDADKGQGYRLGVRVYRSDAFIGTGSLKKGSDSNGKTAATFTGGLGDRKAPLVEMTTEIVRGQSSYSALCDRLGGCQP